MQAETPAPKTRPAWFWPGLFVVGLVAAVALSNREVKSPDGQELIRSVGEYNQVLQQADALGKDPLTRFAMGQKLSDEDFKDLRKASGLFDRLNRFQPQLPGPYFASGKIHIALGEDDVALDKLRQGLLNVVNDIDPKHQPDLKFAAADAQYQAAVIELKKNQPKDAFAAADLATMAVPESSLYHTVRAQALIQLNQLQAAKEDLQVAVKLDPTNERAKGLLKFVSTGKTDSATGK